MKPAACPALVVNIDCASPKLTRSDSTYKSGNSVQTSGATSGGAPALTDLIGNQVQLMFNGIPSSLPALTNGRLRALAVTSRTRVAAIAEVSTVAEAGLKGVEATSWTGLLAPAGTPQQVITRLNKELRAILKSTAIRNRLTADGAEPADDSAAAFAAHLQSEFEKWGKVVRITGARAD